MEIPKYFNSNLDILPDNSIICFLLYGQKRSGNFNDKIILKEFDDPLIAAVYSDSYVEINGVINPEYLPAYDLHKLHSETIINTPLFIRSDLLKQENWKFNENIEYLHYYYMMLQIGNKYIIKHIPELLLTLPFKETIVEKDIQYIQALKIQQQQQRQI